MHKQIHVKHKFNLSIWDGNIENNNYVKENDNISLLRMLYSETTVILLKSVDLL